MIARSDLPPRRAASLGLLLAPMLPTLLALNLPPSPTLVGQCLSLGIWGTVIALLGMRSRALVSSDAWALQASVGICVAASALAVYTSAWPPALALSTLSMLFAFAVVVQVATDQAHEPGGGTRCATWFLLGVVIAGALNAAIGVAQVGWPGAIGGDWIARASLPGRAVGNLRQPNHLSSLLLWAVISAVGLYSMGRLGGRWLAAVGILLLLALVFTGSRTGVLGTFLLAAWGGLDRRLPRAARWALATTPITFVAIWSLGVIWAHATGHAFGSEGRVVLGEVADISSSRFAIWSNTVSMIAREPLLGVGVGEFNLAWTLSAFPDRPTAFFDHTHNLPLQLLVELGVPIGVLVFALLSLALHQAWRRAWSCDGDLGKIKRCAFMLVLMIGLHSMLEYPLWYAYFLLPTGFAWGLALAQSTSAVARPTASADASDRLGRVWRVAGTGMAIGALAAILDYRSVVVIYEPPEQAAPLEERVVRGQHSFFFGHHADYAAATAFGVPTAPLPAAQQLAFRRAPHQLLDVRLMIAWSQALAAEGELDKARWLAARIREFRNPSSDEFFAPCSQKSATDHFQCQPPERAVHWREYVR